MKNKKGAKTQKFIQQVEKQVKSGGLHPLGKPDDKKAEKEKKLKVNLLLLSLDLPEFTLTTLIISFRNKKKSRRSLSQ